MFSGGVERGQWQEMGQWFIRILESQSGWLSVIYGLWLSAKFPFTLKWDQ